MATRNVMIRYLFSDDYIPPKTLIYWHPLPKRLCIRPGPQTPRALSDKLYRTLSAIGGEHMDECKAMSEKNCEHCGAFTERIIQTPMMNMIDGPVPCVGSMVSPCCEKEECEKAIVFGMLGGMDSMGNFGQGHRRPEVQLAYRCGYCEEWGHVKRCQGCQKISYCGRECQRKHWKVHKNDCGPRPEPVD